jgi:hypothetical protein
MRGFQEMNICSGQSGREAQTKGGGVERTAGAKARFCCDAFGTTEQLEEKGPNPKQTLD